MFLFECFLRCFVFVLRSKLILHRLCDSSDDMHVREHEELIILQNGCNDCETLIDREKKHKTRCLRLSFEPGKTGDLVISILEFSPSIQDAWTICEI